MKKIFTFFSALLIALVAFADGTEVAPDLVVTLDGSKTLKQELIDKGYLETVSDPWGDYELATSLNSLTVVTTNDYALTAEDLSAFNCWTSRDVTLAKIDLRNAKIVDNAIPASTFGKMEGLFYEPISGLVEVALPASITSIKSYAFVADRWAPCMLTTINWSELTDLKTIEGEAFFNVSTLENVVIPASVTNYGGLQTSQFKVADESAGIIYTSPFSSTQTVTFDEQSNLIENGVLYMTASVEGSTINVLAKVIGNQTEITTKSNTHAIAQGAFDNTAVAKLTLATDFGGNYNDDYFTLPVKLFENNFTIEEVVLNNKIKIIPSNCFMGSSLKTINFPNNLTTISNGAFYGCESLALAVNFPASVVKIGSEAFKYSGITSIEFEGYNLETLSQGAFNFCRNLSGNVDLSAMTKLTAIGSVAFDQFSGGVFAFTNISGASISNTVEEIGMEAFMNCSNLVAFTITSSVKTIGTDAFKDCNSLIVTSHSDNFINENGILYGYTKDKNNPNADAVIAPIVILEDFVNSGTLILNEDIDFVPSSFFAFKNIEKVVFGPSITKIGYSAFLGCANLKSVELNNATGATLVLESGVFEDCTLLNDVKFPKGQTGIEISYDAFKNCAFTSFTIPGNLVVRGEWGLTFQSSMFAGCPIEQFIISEEDPSNNNLVVVDGVLYEVRGSAATLLAYPCANTREDFTVKAAINGAKLSLSYNCFDGAKYIKNIRYEEGHSDISGFNSYSAYPCAIETIFMPSTTTSVSGFGKATNLKTVTCLALDAPGAYSVFPSAALANATLYVPEESIEKYSLTTSYSQWKNFGNILPFQGTAINNVEYNSDIVFAHNGELFIKNANEVKNLKVYNTTGQLVLSSNKVESNGIAMPKGVNVVRLELANGKVATSKIIVR